MHYWPYQKLLLKSLCDIVQLLPNVTCSIAGTAHTAHIATTSNLYNRQNLEPDKVILELFLFMQNRWQQIFQDCEDS